MRIVSAQDGERRRIARDLHDISLQDLVATTVKLRELAYHVNAGHLQEAVEDSDSCLALVLKIQDDIRTLSYVLHPPMLEVAGLAAALEEYAQGLSRRGAFQVHCRIKRPERRISRQAECGLFRVAQEALTNAWRHSGSPAASIELKEAGDRLILSITDTGRGFAVDGREHGPDGVGIASMTERMHLLGGELVIRSGGSGTCVVAILPMEPADAGPDGYALDGPRGVGVPGQAIPSRTFRRLRPRRHGRGWRPR